MSSFQYQYLAAAVLSAGCLSYLTARRISLIAGVCLAWAFVSALRIFASPLSPYLKEGPTWSTVLDLASAKSLATLFLFTVPVMWLPMRVTRRFFIVLAVANAAVLFVFPPGLLLNASMSACFSAVVLPLIWPKFYPSLLVVAAVLWTRQSVPFGILFAELLCACFIQRWFVALFTLPAILFGAGLLLMGDALLFSNGRFEVWQVCLTWWIQHANIWIGTGSGSFAAIGPYLTRGLHPWGWMHSDFLQILFEQGAIGLALILALLLRTLSIAQSNYFVSCVGFVVFASFNMPLRYPLSALFAAHLLHVVLLKQKIPQNFRALL